MVTMIWFKFAFDLVKEAWCGDTETKIQVI